MWFKEIEHLVDPSSNFLIPIFLKPKGVETINVLNLDYLILQN